MGRRRKNPDWRPNAVLEQKIRQLGQAHAASLTQAEELRVQRNAAWYQAYHVYGYTQKTIADMHNDFIGRDGLGRVSVDAVEKAIKKLEVG